jgi:cytochrome P450
MGFWMLTGYEAIRAAAQNPELFSSSAVRALDPNPQYTWNPLMLDPPEHTKYRQLLAPRFSPAIVDALTPGIHRRCANLIDAVADKGRCEFVTDMSLPFPAAILLQILGLPDGDLDMFVAWEHLILHGTPESDPDHTKTYAAMFELLGYFSRAVADRRADPRDDLISYLPGCTVDGGPIRDEDVLNILGLLFAAGLDTTTAQLSYCFHHFATHPDDRWRILDDPAMIPKAVEEVLRIYGIVTPARKLTRDAVVEGCPMRAGDMVAIPFPSANRDAGEFPDPHTFDMDRHPNRHMAFGNGPHRCAGSHLARRELAVALEEWHRRIPHYRLADDAEAVEHGGGVLGLSTLPLVWDS